MNGEVWKQASSFVILKRRTRHMNLSDLRYFVQVCDDHSISQAAEHFFMTPQGISKAVRRMEEEVGTDLLLRSQSGVHMTEYGLHGFHL
jgi:DNA-binding transcriptional LysR family regulator